MIKELTTPPPEDENRRWQAIEYINSSSDEGVSGIQKLIYRIWNIDQLDWEATRKELLKYPSGEEIANHFERLPYFKELREGKYNQLENDLDKKNMDRVVGEWEGFYKTYADTLDEEMITYYKKELTV